MDKTIERVYSENSGPCNKCYKGMKSNELVNELRLGYMVVRVCDECMGDIIKEYRVLKG